MNQIFIELLPKIIDLGGTVIVSLVALWAIIKIIQMKRNTNDYKNGNVLNTLKKFKENDFNSINFKLDNLRRETDEGNNKLDKIIIILTRLEAIVKTKYEK